MRYMMYVCADPEGEEYMPEEDNIRDWVDGNGRTEAVEIAAKHPMALRPDRSPPVLGGARWTFERSVTRHCCQQAEDRGMKTAGSRRRAKRRHSEGAPSPQGPVPVWFRWECACTTLGSKLTQLGFRS
jgi:hypothetical protein